jgi:hypothetical protein
MSCIIYIIIALLFCKSIDNGIAIRELKEHIKAIEKKTNPESKEGL